MVYKGWQLIHTAKNDELVTAGIYQYIRHPQYVGMWLVTVGFLIQGPTLITLLLMWPVLMILYHRLSKREEKALRERFGEKFNQYKTKVPAYFPRLRKKNS